MASVKRSAYISECGKYRYVLHRVWGYDIKNYVAFVMLNPSTADGQEDDPTIRRCVSFAQSWGFEALAVVNLFAYRATDPKELVKAIDPVGPENDSWIREITLKAKMTIAAWGTKGNLHNRANSLGEILPFLYCLDRTKDGMPKHPLYIAKKAKPEIFGRIGQ